LLKIERVIRLAIILMVSAILVLTAGRVDTGTVLVSNKFDDGDSAGWSIYDWWTEGGVAHQYFSPVSLENQGGVGNSGYIWADDSRWGIDWPDVSILCFIIYPRWTGGGGPENWDLRNAMVSVYLRGESLDLKGGSVRFWVFDSENDGVRYQFMGHPLSVSEGVWTKNTFVLENDESLWYRSWSGDTTKLTNLDKVLSGVDSYGFSFRQFSYYGGEVTGKLEMDEFSITALAPPHADFDGTPKSGVKPLTTVFTDTSTGDYESSLWDFGDSITSTLPSPIHTYTVPGVYSVRLTVNGPLGSDQKTKEGYISVQHEIFFPLISK